MKFKFPLQKVLQHRKILEDLAQRDFQEALSELNLQIQKLRDMGDQVHVAHHEAFTKQNAGGRTGSDLIQIHDFLRGQDIRMERQRAKIQESEKLVENLRDILRQKAIDYKMIESLKNRKKEEFRKDKNKKEQKEADENTTMRFRFKENDVVES